MSDDEKRPLLENEPNPAIRKRTTTDDLQEQVHSDADDKLSQISKLSFRRKNRNLRKFYRKQKELVDFYCEDSDILKDDEEALGPDQESANDRRKRRMDGILAKITFIANVILLIAKIFAAYTSGSLSVVSTVIDSGVDIVSGVVIWITVRAIENRDPYEYPRGRSRLEPVAVIIVSIVMGVANLVMIIQSVTSILKGSMDPVADIATVVILCGGTVIKFVLGIFCYRQKTSSSRVLFMDQRNDIVTNIVALAGAVIGHRLWKYADPIGAILVSTFIAGSWFYMAADQVPILSGKTAPPEYINRIIRVSINHDERIRCLDTVFVYHFGNKYLVELHVVLSPEMTLQEAHDIAEPLQIKLERLPYIERAFVHCDYDIDGVV